MKQIVARIGIFYHTDPVGNVPSGIDSFIRGILQWAPPDLEYTLYGATSDPVSRPVNHEVSVRLGSREVRYLPLIRVDPTAARSVVPRTVQYLSALRQMHRAGRLSELDVLDFHRIEPGFLFRKDSRPKNVILHQDMSVIRDKNSDIKWRHFPWLYERLERQLFQGMDRIFTVRSSAVDRYVKLYPDMKDKFTFIPTWVDTSTFFRAASDGERCRRHRRTMAIPDSARVLVFVGRLDRQKDPLLLLRAFARARARRGDLHLVVIGDGELRPKVEAEVMAGGLQDAVTMTGALSREAIAETLRATDVFVLASAYEGMPIAVLEALACGLPVVSTDVGELRRVIQDGINGFLSKDRTAEALANAILSAVDRMPDLSGAPCESSVIPYHPETVLAQIFGNHRRQAARLTA